MGTVARERVEFLDLIVDAPGHGTADEPVGGDRPRWRAVVLVLLGVGGLLVAARAVGAPPPAARPAADVAPVFGGQVDLPAWFGRPIAMATASALDDDVVWVLGDRGQLVRVVDGRVAAASVAHGYRSVAVRPDGRGVFVTSGRLAPTVVSLDPVSLEPLTDVRTAGPVTALAVGVGSVWAASAGVVEGWTTDLTRPMRTMQLPEQVTAVRSLAIVGAGLQALVTTTSATSALLRLQPPGGAPMLTSEFSGPVSLVPGIPALVGHVGLRDTVEVVADPSAPGVGSLGRPLDPAASIWPANRVGTARWLVSIPVSPSFDCFDASGQLVGRMSVGDTGRGITGPVVTTSRAVYGVTATGALARGGHASCGVAPRASSGGRRGD